MINPADVFTGSMAAVSCAALGLRANLLKPQLATGVTAPTLVWASLWVLSAACAAAAYGLWFSPTFKPVAREMLVYTALGGSSVVMLVNLVMQRPKPTPLVEPPPFPQPTQARWSDKAPL